MIVVPPAFRAMPRWWHDAAGRAWLDALPRLVDEQCRRWRLVLDGPPRHGSNALVVPVRAGARLHVLRLAPPADPLAEEVRALTVWAGRGTVLLHDVDEAHGATLLERLDATRTLLTVELDAAMTVLGELVQTLAVSVPDDVRSTASIATDLVSTLERDWVLAGRPTSERFLVRALDHAAARASATDCPATAADGDLHFAQVLAGERAPWLAVDPVLLRGDPEYDLGRILWSRLDELPEPEDVHAAFDRFVSAAEVPADRARSWVVLRAMSYLLWGLERGLTRDPPRCRRLLELFA